MLERPAVDAGQLMVVGDGPAVGARTGPPAQRHNLPAEGTALIGRESEVKAVRRLVLGAEGRLVTLTGPGGVGKTRLALRVAGDLLGAGGGAGSSGARGPIPDGVWLVELAALTDPALVPQAVATAIGARERPGRPLEDALADWLADRELLLLLDNCEHLLDACARLTGALLRRCPALRVLATSREPLRVPGEVAWRVPSLGVPDAGAALTPEALLAYPATRLFVERAGEVERGFAVGAPWAVAVARR